MQAGAASRQTLLLRNDQSGPYSCCVEPSFTTSHTRSRRAFDAELAPPGRETPGMHSKAYFSGPRVRGQAFPQRRSSETNPSIAHIWE